MRNPGINVSGGLMPSRQLVLSGNTESHASQPSRLFMAPQFGRIYMAATTSRNSVDICGARIAATNQACEMLALLFYRH